MWLNPHSKRFGHADVSTSLLDNHYNIVIVMQWYSVSMIFTRAHNFHNSVVLKISLKTFKTNSDLRRMLC